MTKPDVEIPDSSWAGFLDSMAALMVFVLLVSVVVIILGYTGAAGRRKVFLLNDLFATYTPMYWLLAAIPAGILAGIVSFWQYYRVLESMEGRLGVALQIALISGIGAALISYLLIALVPRFTPSKFRYRPTLQLRKKRA